MPGEVRHRSWLRYFACLMCLTAALLIALDADTTEATGAGALTSPMARFAFYGSVIVLCGGFGQIFRPRLAMLATLIGSGIVVPYTSWRLAAGIWCRALPPCKYTYPVLQFDRDALIWTALLASALVLQFCATRREHITVE
jgi:hypothetical protein